MALPSQPGILLPPPPAGRFLSFTLRHPEDAARVRAAVAGLPIDEGLVVGLGLPLVGVPGLRAFAAMAGPGVAVPSSQAAVWVFVRGEAPDVTFDRARAVRAALGDGALLAEETTTFVYRGGRDLHGYVDGTENPQGDDALDAAFVQGAGPGLDGSSFVAGQRWEHDLAAMAALPPRARDHVIGRTADTDEELDDAPASAHVKRSAQEGYEPPAFMLRRSMPWGDVDRHGLYFVAFGADLDRYERVMRRMVGLDDGVVDALFRISRPVSGGYYWCPPVRGGRLDLSAVG